MQAIYRPALVSLFFLIIVSLSKAHSLQKHDVYDFERLSAPANTSYYIDPSHGDDHNNGKSSKKPWRTFMPINNLILAEGDVVEVMSAGAFHQSLSIKAHGTASNHVIIKFAPGRYDFFPDGAIKKQLYITNANDAPDALKAIALSFENCRFVDVRATGAKIELRGKMIETFIDNSEHIHIDGLSFDYFRPTVSEFKVMDTGANYADVLIHPDSKFIIKDSLLTWIGEGWSYRPGHYWQAFNPATADVSRIDIDLAQTKYVQLADGKVRVYFAKDPGFKKGLVYQNRDVLRDCAGLFMRQCKNIWLQNMHLYFMHGMGVVGQYCENIRISHMEVKPDISSGRTCAAWADILHFSGCKGNITIENSYLSAANDDAINIHGIHLRIIEKLSENKLKVRFMHGQTYGFAAYTQGDSVDFIHPQTLLAYSANRVKSALQLNEKEILLTFDHPITNQLAVNDVLENTTATPSVIIRNDTLTAIPTRGILVTTRRKVLIENNLIQHTFMSGIFINDDASNWYESGMVKDVTISNNHFNNCGEPVIEVHPENTESGLNAVHSHITVTGNYFTLAGSKLFAAKSTAAIKIVNNKIKTAFRVADVNDLISFTNCYDTMVSGNQLILNDH